MSRKTKRCNNIIKIISVITSLIGALTAIVGTVFVVLQFNSLQEQGKSVQNQIKLLMRQDSIYMEQLIIDKKRLVEDYRPVGIFSIETGDPNKKGMIGSLTTIQNNKSSSQFDLYFESKLFNIGKGLMIYHGSIFKITEENASFRNILLNGDTSGILYDNLPSEARGTFIIDEMNQVVRCMFKKIWPSQYKHIHILNIYSDVSGNLYDTEVNTKIFFEKKRVNGQLLFRLDPKKMYSSIQLHKYSTQEIKQLLSTLNKTRHSLYDNIKRYFASALDVSANKKIEKTQAT